MEINSGRNESSQNVILMTIPQLSKYVTHYLALLHATLFLRIFLRGMSQSLGGCQNWYKIETSKI